MDRPATTDRFRNAQRSLDSQEDPRFEAEYAEEHVTDLALSYRNDPALCREAAYLSAGTLGGQYYTDVQLALHKLHHTHPADLAGSEALTQLYRLARVEAEALDAKLVDLARIALAEQRVAA
ncbi:MAG: hypothetical protein GAK31_01704 [Stenotrophomonas maltophilia]|uniref:Uncharacterized protein n=1 Tax=Stenotrophomonas maltophilia TaxID=40324 RepID=A0A7V8FI05_STEMA|nr:MAG: hypothetical protein GAK31_01704 [Stenotrophomonas maltophilia]